MGRITVCEATTLRLSRHALLDRYAAQHVINHEAQAELIGTITMSTISDDMKQVLFGSTIHLILFHE